VLPNKWGGIPSRNKSGSKATSIKKKNRERGANRVP